MPDLLRERLKLMLLERAVTFREVVLSSGRRSNYYIDARMVSISGDGLALTVEPGIYVRPAEGVPEEFWHIGIRIEDDVIVTGDGCRVLSNDAPKGAAEIEELMKECSNGG